MASSGSACVVRKWLPKRSISPSRPAECRRCPAVSEGVAFFLEITVVEEGEFVSGDTSPGSSPQLPSSTSSPRADAVPSPSAPTATNFPSLHQFDLSTALAMMRPPGAFNLVPPSHSFASAIPGFPNLSHPTTLGFGSLGEVGFSPTTSIALSTLHKRRRLSRPVSPSKSAAGSLSPGSPQRKQAESIPDEKKVRRSSRRHRGCFIKESLHLSGFGLLGASTKEQRRGETIARYSPTERGANRAARRLLGAGKSEAQGASGGTEE